MKTLRGLFILLILLSVTMAHGQVQEQEDTDIYYAYELSQGEATPEGDTSYQAYIIIDSLEILKYEKLVILNEKYEKVIKVKPKDLEKENKLSRIESSYRIDVERWMSKPDWIVFGEKADNSKKYFKSWDKKEKEKEKEKVIHYPIPVRMAPKTEDAPVNPK